MPHRTVFQWGKNHAHPFTVFIGGLVIGALVTGAAVYAWMAANQTAVEFEDVVIVQVATGSPDPLATPTETPLSEAESQVQF